MSEGRLGDAATFDLASFSLDDVDVAADALREIASDVRATEQAAQQVVEYLYSSLVDGGTGGPACALVRMYMTHPYASLDPGLQEFARNIAGDGALEAETRCFTLLGSMGHEPEWRSRHTSVRHRAIPLANAQMVERLPMINQLFIELGLEIGAVVDPRAHNTTELAQRAYGVFHVEEAQGSPYIPAQLDFVVPNGIRSAVGFGGVLHSGSLYAVILFATVPVSAVVARRLKILSLPLRVPLLRLLGRDIFLTPA